MVKRALNGLLTGILGFNFFLLPLYHYHPGTTHAHEGKIEIHDHEALVHSYELETLAHNLTHKGDPREDHSHSHTHPLSKHESSDALFDFQKSFLPKDKLKIVSKHGEIAPALRTNEPKNELRPLAARPPVVRSRITLDPPSSRSPPRA
ncbi:MAG: hypothetical protein COV67_08335 [Nitrospinae bacterium CG11_big_fil_rev_8_21_14_0_20_56_8]|nr:MAG: hypothetical protein COV67_08335 [Nitrospinae bacterium CG11_big_fil_rev_8_21_14_0_20_56_8]